MSDKPYIPTGPDSTRADMESVSPSDQGERLLARRFAAWIIDSLALTLLLVITLAMALMTHGIAHGISATLEKGIHGLVGHKLSLAIGVSLCLIFWTIWTAFWRTPGFVLMGLRLRSPSEPRRIWWLRSSRFFSFPALYWLALIEIVFTKLLVPGPQAMHIYNRVDLLASFAAVLCILVAPFFCLSSSGQSPLDRLFGSRVVRSGQV